MADALSRREGEATCDVVTMVVPDWVREITKSYDQTEWIEGLQE